VIKVYLGTLSINRDDGDGTTSGRPRRRSLHPQLASRRVKAAQRSREALADERRHGAHFEAAWYRCVERVLEGERVDNARQWRTAFLGAEGAWRDGYARVGPPCPLAVLALPCDEPRGPVDAHGMLTNA
jgi:hypothetical protein